MILRNPEIIFLIWCQRITFVVISLHLISSVEMVLFFAARSPHRIKDNVEMTPVLSVLEHLYVVGLANTRLTDFEIEQERNFFQSTDSPYTVIICGCTTYYTPISHQEGAYKPIVVENKVNSFLFKERVDLTELVYTLFNGTDNLKKFGYKVDAQEIYNFVFRILKHTCVYLGPK